MLLNGEQRKYFQEVLIEAFPSKVNLQHMLMHQMTENLEAITTGNNLQDITFSLIDWAETLSKTGELVTAACKENPTNLILQKFATWYDSHTGGIPSHPFGRINALPLEHVPKPAALPIKSRILFHPNSFFVGRHDYLKAVATAFKQEQTLEESQVTVVVITGIGGIGKTQIASEFVHRYGHYFAGGVYWLSCAKPESIPEEIAACGGSGAMDLPGLSEISLDKQVKRVQQEWRDTIPRLLVFDNCEDEELFSKWAPKTGGCRVLVTSRRATWSSWLNVQTISLEELSRQESIALLRKFRPDLEETDTDLNELAEVLGDLPLALHLAGNFLEIYKNDTTVPQYINELHDEALLKHESLQGIDCRNSPTNHKLHVGMTFVKSYEKLVQEQEDIDPLALKLLDCMAWFAPGEIVPHVLIQQTEIGSNSCSGSKRQVSRALNRLTDIGLLTKNELENNNMGDPRFWHLHVLLAKFVQQANPENHLESQKSVQQAIIQFVTSADDSGEAAKIISIHAHIQHVLLPKSIDEHTDLLQRIDCHLAIAESSALIRDVEMATIHYEQANTLLEQIKQTYPSVDTLHHTARLCYGMGTLLVHTNSDESLCWLNKGIAIVKKSGTRYEAKLLFRKGVIYNNQGEFDSSLVLLQKALILFAEDDIVWRIRTLTALGSAFFWIGDVEKSKDYHNHALEQCEQNCNEYEMIPIYTNKATHLEITGEWKESKETYQKALKLAEKLRNSSHLVITLNLGILLTNMGDYTEAYTYLDMSIRNSRLYEMQEVLIDALISMSDLSIRMEKWDEATQCIEQTEKVIEANPSLIIPRQQAEIHRAKALTFLARGDQKSAFVHAKKSVAINNADNNADMEIGMSYRVLGQVLVAFGKLETAIACFAKSLSCIEIEEDVPYEVARTYLEWARAEQLRGNYAVATTHLEKAKTLFDKLGAKRDQELVEQIKKKEQQTMNENK